MAVKVVSKKSLNKSSMENLLTEIEILKTVRHPHIVQLKDFQVQCFQEIIRTFLVTEVQQQQFSDLYLFKDTFLIHRDF